MKHLVPNMFSKASFFTQEDVDTPLRRALGPLLSQAQDAQDQTYPQSPHAPGKTPAPAEGSSQNTQTHK